MSTESQPNADYYSVSSGSKRRKLSNDSTSSKSALPDVSSESLKAASAVEDPGSASAVAESTQGEALSAKDKAADVVSGSSVAATESATNAQTTEPKPLDTAKQAESADVADKKPSQASPPKPVFGAASAFGNASIFEKMKSRTNVFDTPNRASTGTSDKHTLAVSSSILKSPDSSVASKASSTSSFGSFGGSFGANSKFGNALEKASQKKSFLDEPESEDTTAESQNSQTTQQYKQVDLKETTVTTGEENETSIFNATTKLFELHFSKLSEGWKERGVGPLHLNKALGDKAQARLVMRSKGLLRVILNYAINPSTVLIKGLEASLSPGKFIRMNAISEGQPVQYMLKFGNEELRNELFDKVEQLKEELKTKAEEPAKETSKETVSTPKKPQATGFRFIDHEASPGARTDED